jgi:hypothetical protein
MDAQQLDIPPPTNPQDFENLCHAIWECEWNCATIQRNGRSGQKQRGVDIFGQPHGEVQYHGIQCKVKSGDTAGRPALTRSEIDHEVAEAKFFIPPLAKLIIATTAPQDAGLQEYARELSEQHAAAGLFAVAVLSWPEIKARLAKHETVLARFYEIASSSSRQIKEDVSAIRERLGELGRPLEPDLRWDQTSADPAVESALSSLLYSSRRDPLVGREGALAFLWRFLNDEKRQFLWLLLTAPGGEGKSRLAFELANAARRHGWHAGKLGRRELASFKPSRWRPSRPTLMVIDYAAQHASETNWLMEELSGNEAVLEQKVRLLLLERSHEWQWFKKMLPASDAGKRIGNHAYLPDHVLRLEPLDRSSLIDLMAGRFLRAGIPPPDSEILFSLAERIDRRGVTPRPLFAAAAAEAIMAVARPNDLQNDRDRWTHAIAMLDRETVLDFLIERDREQFWLNRSATDQELESKRLEKHERILFLSTFAQEELTREDLKRRCPKRAQDYLPSHDAGNLIFLDSHRLRRMATDAEGELPVVKPDILGEHYVLQQLEAMEPDERGALFEAALVLGGAMASSFIRRCAADFPERARFITTIAPLLHDSRAQLEYVRAQWLTGARTEGDDDDLPITLASAFTQSAKRFQSLHPENQQIKIWLAYGSGNLVCRANHDDASDELTWLKKLGCASTGTPELRSVAATSASTLIDRFLIQKKFEHAQRELEWLQQFCGAYPMEVELREAAVKSALKFASSASLEQAASALSWLRGLASDGLLIPKHMITLAEMINSRGSEADSPSGDRDIAWLIEQSRRHPQIPAMRIEAAIAVVERVSKAGSDTSLRAYEWLEQAAIDYSSEEMIVRMAATAAAAMISRENGETLLEKLGWLRRLAAKHPLDSHVRLQAATGAMHAISKLNREPAELELAWLKSLSKKYPSDYDLLVQAVLGAVNLVRHVEPDRGAQEVAWLRWLATDLPSEPSMRLYAAAATVHLIRMSPIQAAQVEETWLKSLAARYPTETNLRVQAAIGGFDCMSKLMNAYRIDEARMERDWISLQSTNLPEMTELGEAAAAAVVQFYRVLCELGEAPSSDEGLAAAEAVAMLLPGCHEERDADVILSLREVLRDVRRRFQN